MGVSPEQVFLIHYHEIGLKGGNRRWFEDQLRRNIEQALRGVPRGPVRRVPGRIVLELSPDSLVDVVRERLRGVFGIANFSQATQIPTDIQAIREAAWDGAQKVEFGSFKIRTKRADKSFHMTSEDINRDVGAHIQQLSQAAVRMDNPDLTCFVEIATQGTYVYTEKVPGPGGLPVGVSEKAVSLLSSGIDSPVASYRAMKRGVRLVFLHFHSQPYTNRNSQRNAEELVRVLTRHQFRSTLYLVPFAAFQRQIMTHSDPAYRVILYRRAMFRIADAISKTEGAQALVTGENIGQVASQTLSNLRAIEEVTALPVLRPLAGEDKVDIVAQARQIGTYEISIEPYEDCCSLFVPKHPETHADLQRVHDAESHIDVPPLIEAALRETELKQFRV